VQHLEETVEQAVSGVKLRPDNGDDGPGGHVRQEKSGAKKSPEADWAIKNHCQRQRHHDLQRHMHRQKDQRVFERREKEVVAQQLLKISGSHKWLVAAHDVPAVNR